MWDNEIVSYLSKIHECKGRQELYLRQKPAELERLVEIAKVQSTEASNRIEGIITTNARLKQLVEDKTTPRNRDEMEILGYRNVLNLVHENYLYIPVEPSYILQLHRDLLRFTNLSYGGRFKTTPNEIDMTLPTGERTVLFRPLEPYETPGAVEALCRTYREALEKEWADPLILIPCFILDFLCIHPFHDGNGRMSRLLTLLMLYQNGYLVGQYISIEKRSRIRKTPIMMRWRAQTKIGMKRRTTRHRLSNICWGCCCPATGNLKTGSIWQKKRAQRAPPMT